MHALKFLFTLLYGFQKDKDTGTRSKKAGLRKGTSQEEGFETIR
jgi:hypothetical protein